MANFLELKKRVADALQRDDLMQQIDDALNSAIRHYSNDVWNFTSGFKAITLQPSQQTYNLDMVRVDRVCINDNPKPLCREYHCFSSDSYGEPTAFNIEGDSIHFFPIPDAYYNIKVYGQFPFGKHVDTDDTPWTNEAQDLIYHRALSLIYSDILLEHDNARAFSEREKEQHYNLQRHSIRKLATNIIKEA